MKKILCLLLAAMPIMPLDASDRRPDEVARISMQVNRIGAGTGRQAPATVPVTTTIDTHIHVPEVNIEHTTQTIHEINIEGERAACLMTAGNVWASRMYSSSMGVPLGAVMSESIDPEQNVCFSTVSVRSTEIPNMARFFQPVRFQVGLPIECGSWLDEARLDEAILDARRSQRVAGTIAAGVGGAVVGIALTEAIGRNFIDGWMGQQDAELSQMLDTLAQNQCSAMRGYHAALYAKVDACNTPGVVQPASCGAARASLREVELTMANTDNNCSIL